ncbi:MAG: GFA family protein [Xanthomonadales bacterium]|nr:GFA family protein [Xanthomonadales bacterium]
MTEVITGGCRCGAVRYQLEAPPLFKHMCCCRDCQYFTGTDKMFIVGGMRSAFHLTSGSVRHYAVTADSGATIHRAFCPQCGSSLLIYPEVDQKHYMPGDDVVGVAAGSLDEPGAFQPDAVVFTSRAPSWATFPEGVEQHP